MRKACNGRTFSMAKTQEAHLMWKLGDLTTVSVELLSNITRYPIKKSNTLPRLNSITKESFDAYSVGSSYERVYHPRGRFITSPSVFSFPENGTPWIFNE